jgi:hypothetical protein
MDYSSSQLARSAQQLSMSDDVQLPAERQQSAPTMADASPRASVISGTDVVEFEPDEKPRHLSLLEAERSPEAGASPQWNANYFPLPPHTPSKDRRPSSAAGIAAGASSPEELLRRFSLAGRTRKLSDVTEDPRTLHPNLHLSGNVISATFCVPYRIGYSCNGNWVCPIVVSSRRQD